MSIFLDNLSILTDLILLLIISISFRIILQVLGQRWITTVSHTGTLVILPLITYVITNVISGNIALSLGMVGALSIVRFRHPVRSPLELCVYFGAITMGIAATVNTKWLIFLFGASLASCAVILLINVLSKKFLNIPFFNASFSEGNSLSTLDIFTKDENQRFDNSDHLVYKTVTDDHIHYTLSSTNFNSLLDLQKDFKGDANILRYQLNR